MPQWSDFGNIWSTLREVDVSGIREEAEQPVAIVCLGQQAAIAEVERLLSGTGAECYPGVGMSPLVSLPLAEADSRRSLIDAADMLLIALDAREALDDRMREMLQRAIVPGVPALTVLLFNAPAGSNALALPRAAAGRSVAIAAPDALDAADRLAAAVLGVLPSELHLSACRRLPGLRAAYTRDLINSVSFSNAGYSLATGIPEMIPVLNIPFAAADILVLTKNQALMVYRLALAHGAPPEFQARIREVLPVVGGAFLWREAARSLASLVPVWGVVPKIAIAYAGTYTTGIVAWRWFANGEIVSSDQIKRISREAMAIGRKRAAELIERTQQAQQNLKQNSGNRGLRERVRGWLPGRKAQLPDTPKSTETPTPGE